METQKKEFDIQEKFPNVAEELANSIRSIDLAMMRDIGEIDNLEKEECLDLIREFVTRKHCISCKTSSHTLEIQLSIDIKNFKKEESEGEE